MAQEFPNPNVPVSPAGAQPQPASDTEIKTPANADGNAAQGKVEQLTNEDAASRQRRESVESAAMIDVFLKNTDQLERKLEGQEEEELRKKLAKKEEIKKKKKADKPEASVSNLNDVNQTSKAAEAQAAITQPEVHPNPTAAGGPPSEGAPSLHRPVTVILGTASASDKAKEEEKKALWQRIKGIEWSYPFLFAFTAGMSAIWLATAPIELFILIGLPVTGFFVACGIFAFTKPNGLGRSVLSFASFGSVAGLTVLLLLTTAAPLTMFINILSMVGVAGVSAYLGNRIQKWAIGRLNAGKGKEKFGPFEAYDLSRGRNLTILLGIAISTATLICQAAFLEGSFIPLLSLSVFAVVALSLYKAMAHFKGWREASAPAKGENQASRISPLQRLRNNLDSLLLMAFVSGIGVFLLSAYQTFPIPGLSWGALGASSSFVAPALAFQIGLPLLFFFFFVAGIAFTNTEPNTRNPWVFGGAIVSAIGVGIGIFFVPTLPASAIFLGGGGLIGVIAYTVYTLYMRAEEETQKNRVLTMGGGFVVFTAIGLSFSYMSLSSAKLLSLAVQLPLVVGIGGVIVVSLLAFMRIGPWKEKEKVTEEPPIPAKDSQAEETPEVSVSQEYSALVNAIVAKMQEFKSGGINVEAIKDQLNNPNVEQLLRASTTIFSDPNAPKERVGHIMAGILLTGFGKDVATGEATGSTINGLYAIAENFAKTIPATEFQDGVLLGYCFGRYSKDAHQGQLDNAKQEFLQRGTRSTLMSHFAKELPKPSPDALHSSSTTSSSRGGSSASSSSSSSSSGFTFADAVWEKMTEFKLPEGIDVNVVKGKLAEEVKSIPKDEGQRKRAINLMAGMLVGVSSVKEGQLDVSSKEYMTHLDGFYSVANELAQNIPATEAENDMCLGFFVGRQTLLSNMPPAQVVLILREQNAVKQRKEASLQVQSEFEALRKQTPDLNVTAGAQDGSEAKVDSTGGVHFVDSSQKNETGKGLDTDHIRDALGGSPEKTVAALAAEAKTRQAVLLPFDRKTHDDVLSTLKLADEEPDKALEDDEPDEAPEDEEPYGSDPAQWPTFNKDSSW